MKIFRTVPAHFDGKEIRLDVPISLETNVRLLVTHLDPAEDDSALIYAAMMSSEKAFIQIWDNDEDAIYDNL